MIGLILDSHSIEGIKSLAKRAEIAGFDSVWTTELYRTSFQQLAAVASVTSSIKLGTAVALAFVRSPLITALTALDIDEASDGRFILGLGTGAKRTNEKFHGVPFGRPRKHISECIEIIRLVTRNLHTDNNIRYEGEYYNIDMKGFVRPFIPVRNQIPIYLAGIGSNMVRTAAEIADGYLGHVVCSLDYLKKIVIPSIEKGLQSSGRKKKDFTTASIITCAISDDINEAREAAKATIAFYAIVKTYSPPFEMHGFQEIQSRIREAYFDRDIQGMIRQVTDEMVDCFSVVGSAERCIEKIEKYREVIDLPILSAPHYFIDHRQLEKFQEEIIKTFGK